MKRKLKAAASILSLLFVSTIYLAVFFVPIDGLEDVHGAKAAAFALIAATTLALGLILGSEWKPFSTLTQVMAVGAAYSSGGEWMLSATGGQVPLLYIVVWGAAGSVLSLLILLVVFRVIRRRISCLLQ